MCSQKLLVLSAVFSVLSLYASPTGSISGSVKDPTGSVIAGATVTLTNTATNAKIVTASNPSGEFQFPQLAPASYSLTVEAKGFKRFVTTVLVEVDQITHVNAALEVGEMTQSVEVISIAPLLENDKSTLSSVVENQAVQNMPLNARQFLDLALLTPGTTPAATGTQGGGFNVAGARSQGNNYLLDGVSNIDTQINSALNNFRITDAVQEFAVQTSVPTAEFGRGTGGQVSVVTKSGTNAFHGSAFEYFRNSKLDAADFFTNKLGSTKNPLHRNQFGGTLGGPIIKDKTFFFASYEGFRQVANTVSSTTVPTDAQRASVTDPISRNLLQFWPAPNAAQASSTVNFIANVRSSTFDHTGLGKIDHNFSEKDHLSLRWIEYQGTTFTPGALPAEGGNANTPVSRNALIDEVHTFSPSLLQEFRFGYSRNETFFTVQDQGLNAATIFQVNGQPLPGVVNGAQDPLNSGLPTVNVSGGFAPLGSTNNLPQGRTTNTYEIFDNVTLVHNRHSFRFGVHVRDEQARRFLNGSSRGSFNFTNFTDFAAGMVNTSTFLTGSTLRYWQRYPWAVYAQDQYKIKDNLTLNYGVRYEYPSAIYQTRQGGVNFVPFVGPVILGTNQVVNVDPTKTGPSAIFLTPGPVNLSDSGVNSDKNNVAPIVGFAYTPRVFKKIFGNDDTVIRGGYRIGYDDIFNNIPANMGLNPPFALATAQTSGVTQPGKFPWAIGFNQNVPLVSNVGKQGPGTPTSGVLSFNAEDPHIASTYAHQYSLGIQRRLTNVFSIEVDYQGSTGHKLGLFLDQNQPYVTVNNPAFRGNQAPNQQLFPYSLYGAVPTGQDVGNSIYNGMVVTATYRGTRGIFFQASYTLGRSLDDKSSFFGSLSDRSALTDSRNVHADWGPSTFDVRHRFVAFYVVDVPIGPGHRIFGWNNGLNRQVLGGWQISGITTLQSGTPYTVYNNSQDFSGFNQFADRPDYTCTGPLPQNNLQPDTAFSKTCFSAQPPTGRVGTTGRDQFYGPGLINFDFTAAKNFPLYGERVKLQFRTDFFNLFNNVNFANPVSNQSSVSFGKIIQTVGSAVATAVGTTAGAVGGSRIIQLAMRVQF
jgi:hypothetical protein